jgi:hypothetical protein
LESIEDKVLLPVVCRAEVDALRGNGREAAEMGCMVAEESVLIAPPKVLEIFRSMLDSDEFPADCRAEVDAPVGSGRLEADTGCVKPEPSVRRTPELVTARFRRTFDPSTPATLVAWDGLDAPGVPTELLVTVMEPVTGTGLWSEAIVTGAEDDMGFWPSVPSLASIDDRELLPAFCRAAVEAPVGRAEEDMELMFQEPDCDTAIGDWSFATVTGTDPDMVFWPRVGVFESMEVLMALPAFCRAEVDAPAGSGRLAADTGWVVVPVGSTRRGFPDTPSSWEPPEAEDRRLTPWTF